MFSSSNVRSAGPIGFLGGCQSRRIGLVGRIQQVLSVIDAMYLRYGGPTAAQSLSTAVLARSCAGAGVATPS